MDKEVTNSTDQNDIELDFFDFGVALDVLKKGHRVTREGWNGKGMYIFLLDGHGLPDIDGNVADYTKYETQPFIVMKTADNKLVPWIASQSDLLADDWEFEGDF